MPNAAIDEYEAAVLAVDPSGGAYLAGATGAPSFPDDARSFWSLFRAGRGVGGFFGQADRPTALRWEYATYLGGSGDAQISGIAIDPACDASCIATVVGSTTGVDFPLVNPIAAWGQQSSGYIGFIAQVSPTGSSLLFSSRFYFSPGQVTEDSQGDFFVTGASGASMLTVHPLFKQRA